MADKGKIVLLLGAGASKGAGHIDEANCPPLGGEVFPQIVEQFPGSWGQIEKHLWPCFTQDFEQGMAIVRELARMQEFDGLVRLQQDMALFFCKYRIDDPKKNLYSRFVGEHRKLLLSQDIVLATLNYDTLIDQAILAHNLNRSYNAESGVGLLKLHGSSNFATNNALTTVNGDVTYNDGTIELGIKVVLPWEVEKEVESNPFPPVMSLYLWNKEDITGGKALGVIRDKYRQVIESADLIIVIGVRYNSTDRHVWEPMEKALGRPIEVHESAEGWSQVKGPPTICFCNDFCLHYHKIRQMIRETRSARD